MRKAMYSIEILTVQPHVCKTPGPDYECERGSEQLAKRGTSVQTTCRSEHVFLKKSHKRLQVRVNQTPVQYKLSTFSCGGWREMMSIPTGHRVFTSVSLQFAFQMWTSQRYSQFNVS